MAREFCIFEKNIDMKKVAKAGKQHPEIQVLGDLEDVKSLYRLFRKNKHYLVFHDGDTGVTYTAGKKGLREAGAEKATKLGKKDNVLKMDFYPSRKPVLPPPPEDQPGAGEPVPEEGVTAPELSEIPALSTGKTRKKKGKKEKSRKDTSRSEKKGKKSGKKKKSKK
jgi:hypothetical protein